MISIYEDMLCLVFVVFCTIRCSKTLSIPTYYTTVFGNKKQTGKFVFIRMWLSLLNCDLVVYTSIKYTNWSMDTMGYNKAADINPRLLQLSAIASLMQSLSEYHT